MRDQRSDFGTMIPTVLPDDHSEQEPPDSIPNSEVKLLSADGSAVFRRVRVGHCQASKQESPFAKAEGLFCLCACEKSPARRMGVGFGRTEVPVALRSRPNDPPWMAGPAWLRVR